MSNQRYSPLLKLLVIVSLSLVCCCCTTKSYGKNEGMIILKQKHKKPDSITYASDSVTFLEWKNMINLKPGDTAIFLIESNYKSVR